MGIRLWHETHYFINLGRADGVFHLAGEDNIKRPQDIHIDAA